MKIMICGSGTMGRGIALVSILSGHSAILFDKNQEALNQAKAFIDAQLKKSLEKGNIKKEQFDDYSNQCVFTGELSEQVSHADIVIEAIIESLEIKEALFASIEESGLREDAILATNTSSLSVNILSKNRKYPHNFIGLHFFNPAHIMKLVEIIRTPITKEEVLHTALEYCRSIKKVPVIAKDVPGFIVNRVARNYYNEAMRIATENASNPKQIDTLMKSLGFKMGPFELMDLIGNDVNLEVTKSVAAQYFNEPRFTPSLMQQDIVNAGRYGRKSGAGFYEYE
jgi:3-hydroxybutyryl-CoA dehydrogenase